MSILKTLFLPLSCAVLLLVPAGALAGKAADIPTLDAGLGVCRADFTIKDNSGKGIYGAKVEVSIKYGFMNLHDTDLDGATNSDGQVRFTGLPNFSKKPLAFQIKSGDVLKTVTDDPAVTCHATYDFTFSVR